MRSKPVARYEFSVCAAVVDVHLKFRLSHWPLVSSFSQELKHAKFLTLFRWFLHKCRHGYITRIFRRDSLTKRSTTTYLTEWLYLGVHNKRKLAQLTGTRIRSRQPLLQTRLMHILQTAGTVTGCQQRIICIILTMANPTDVNTALRRLAASGSVSEKGNKAEFNYMGTGEATI